jgi:hypothetical protein
VSANRRRGFKVSVLGLVSGAFGGLGVLILLQQSGTLYPTRTAALIGLVVGVGVGVGLPMLATIGGPRTTMPPEEALAAPAAPETVLAMRSPADGMQGWDEPDPERAPMVELEGGRVLRVLEQRGDWALVVTDQDVRAWVDARRLESLDTP